MALLHDFSSILLQKSVWHRNSTEIQQKFYTVPHTVHTLLRTLLRHTVAGLLQDTYYRVGPKSSMKSGRERHLVRDLRHFPQKSPINSGSFAENDLQHTTPFASVEENTIRNGLRSLQLKVEESVTECGREGVLLQLILINCN